MCLTICADIACCAGQSVCKGICCCCESTLKTTFKQHIKLAYLFFYVLAIILTIFCLYLVGEAFSFVNGYLDYLHCPKESGGNLNCFGLSAVFRMSLALVIFFAIIFLVCFARNECAKQLNEGLWPLKVLFVLGIFILFFFIDNSVFEAYVIFSKYASIIFLVFQLIMLIDFFYLWGESWVQNYDSGNAQCKYFMIIATFLLYGGTLTLIILNFIWFSGCTLQIVFMIVNIIFVVLMTILTVYGWAKQGSLITSGAECLYVTYLTYSSLVSFPSIECNKKYSSVGVQVSEMLLGGFWILVSLGYLVLAQQTSDKIKISNNIDINKKIINHKDDDDEDEDDTEKDEEKKQFKEKIVKNEEGEEVDKKLRSYKTNNWVMFHLIMVVASFYICMLLTNWGDAIFVKSAIGAYTTNQTSFWIKIILSWASCLLYIWTLIAPKILSNREFK